MNHSYAFEVRLHDVDHAGVMFFARLFVHAHDAYEDFMAHLGLDLCAMITTGERLPVVHADADYFQPLRHGEKITVTLEIEALGKTSFTVSCSFYSVSGLLAKVRTVHVHLDPHANTAADLPQMLREMLQPYCKTI
ncbi:MAG: acyl-CoA thioesterase [Gammaproteobacteria bacterium]|nr:acyl-CoA thioesterase [Gammaproteobacteria bacterium]MBU1731267.1 acyl-CoA thioesterase [Gammaproteobacteria bacterium]MBU1892772.1 acyl-CoA thioesterase [Gammaproteobacteria bacterium]